MSQRLVRDVMVREVMTLQRNDALAIADRVMQLERIRHLPVLDEDGLVCGVVSQRDLFKGALATALGYGSRAQEKLLATLLVKEVMSTTVVTTYPDATLADAARKLLEHKIGCLPVLDGDKLVGIVSESDFVALVASGA